MTKVGQFECVMNDITVKYENNRDFRFIIYGKNTVYSKATEHNGIAVLDPYKQAVICDCIEKQSPWAENNSSVPSVVEKTFKELTELPFRDLLTFLKNQPRTQGLEEAYKFYDIK